MSINLMYVLKYANHTAETSDGQKERRKPKFIHPKIKEDIKPNQTIKLTMRIPKYNNGDYSLLNDSTRLILQNSKIRKIIKPDGSHYFVIVPINKRSYVPSLKINNQGDVFVHQKNKITKYRHSKLPIFYEDIVSSIKKINKIFFPLTQGEKDTIKNNKLLNRIGRFLGRLFKKG